MNIKKYWKWGAIIAVLLSVTYVLTEKEKPAALSDANVASTAYIAVAKGRVDIEGGVIKLAAQRDGIIQQVLVEEGAHVKKDQILAVQDKGGENISPEVEQLDFEFVLFASAVIDYDYIMALIAKYSNQKPSKKSMSRDQLIGLIASDAKFMDEREDIAAYIYTLKQGEGLSEKEIRDGYADFKAEKNAMLLAAIAAKHGLQTASLQAFVDGNRLRSIWRTIYQVRHNNF